MLEFAKSGPFTLGVEMELQVIDRDSGELSARAEQFLDGWTGPQRVRAELFQSMLELNTTVCQTAADAERCLRATAVPLLARSRELGVRFISSGTHPTARYQDRQVFPAERYYGLVERNQWIARKLLIFGLHVHIGMPDPETCIAVQNELLHDLGLLLAISTSSPFSQGEATGLASSRITAFEAMPTGGTPALVADWSEFSTLVDALMRSGAITSMKDLWWDIRPSPRFGTLEIRVCDGLPTIRETCAVVALSQALARRAGARIEAGDGRSFPPAWRIRENKWRASRHGMEADLVTGDDGTTVGCRAWLGTTLDELESGGYFTGSASYLPDLRRFVDGAPTSAVRQRRVFERTQDFDAVTLALADEFEADVLGVSRLTESAHRG
ncbi:MAG: YbdK family carboxylate-amine ligase [Gemmatimonadetes bacterium]|nr:YbdK family carboxylate-amine ligase [Gemmatimonadota bacterium]